MYPFGLPIVAYLFLAGIASGSALTASLSASSSNEDRARTARRTIVCAGLLASAGAAFLIADLARPEDFGLILATANPSSAISWGARILIVFTLAALAAGSAGASRGRFDELVLWVLRIAAVAMLLYPAFVLGQARAMQPWQGAALLPLIAVSSLHAGACWARMLDARTGPARGWLWSERCLGVLQIGVALWFFAGAGTTPSLDQSVLFWCVFLVAGTVVPLAISAWRPEGAIVGRCAMVVVGSLALRAWVLGAGQEPSSL